MSSGSGSRKSRSGDSSPKDNNKDLDNLVMENALLEQEMKDEMKDMENRVTERLQVEIAATSLGLREQIGAQFAGLMDLLAKN